MTATNGNATHKAFSVFESLCDGIIAVAMAVIPANSPIDVFEHSSSLNILAAIHPDTKLKALLQLAISDWLILIEDRLLRRVLFALGSDVVVSKQLKMNTCSNFFIVFSSNHRTS